MENNLTYIQNGDYLIPDLRLSEQPMKPLGKYGRMRKAYLKEHRPLIYNQLLLTEKLYPHLIEIDETAQSRLEQMMPQLGHHLFQSALGGLVDLDEVRVQLLGQQQLIVNQGPVFLQVRFPHPAVLAQGLHRLLAQAQVGDQVIPVLNVSQIVLHVWHSFPRFWRAHSSGW